MNTTENHEEWDIERLQTRLRRKLFSIDVLANVILGLIILFCFTIFFDLNWEAYAIMLSLNAIYMSFFILERFTKVDIFQYSKFIFLYFPTLAIVFTSIILPQVHFEAVFFLPLVMAVFIYEIELNKAKWIIMALLCIGMIIQLTEHMNNPYDGSQSIQMQLLYAVIILSTLYSMIRLYLISEWIYFHNQQITYAHKRVEEKRQELQSFMSDIPSGYSVFTAAAQRLYCSQESANIFGYETVAELQSVALPKLFADEESIAKMEKLIADTQSGHYHQEGLELNALHKSGREMVLKCRASIKKINNQNRLSIVYQDQTEEIKRNKEIQANERLLQSIINTTQDGLMVIDRDHTIVHANQVSLNDLKINETPETIAGQNLLDFVPQENQERVLPLMQEAFDGVNKRIQIASKLIPGKYLDMSYHPIHNGSQGVDKILASYRDISDIKSKEKELKETTHKLQTIIDTIPGGIAIIGLDAKLKYISKEIVEEFDYATEELIGTSILDYYDDEGKDRLLKYTQYLLEGKTPKMLKLRAFRKDGSSIYMNGTGRLMYDSEYDETVIIAVFMNTTDMAKVEEEKEKTQATLNAIFNSTSDSIIAYDTDYNILAYNPKWLENYHKVSDRSIDGHKNLKSILPSEVFTFLSQNTEKAMSEGYYEIKKAHDLVPGETNHIRVVPLIDHRNRTIGVLEVMTDISESIKKEKELNKSRRIFDDVFRHSPNGIIRIRDHKIADANPAFCSMLGYDKSDIVGHHPRAFSTGEGMDRIEKEIRDSIAQRKKGTTVHHLMETKQGNTKNVVVNVIHEYEDEQLIESICTITDVTPIIEAEKEVLKSREKYKSLFELSLTGKYVATSHVIEQVNPALSGLIGYPEAEIIDKSILNFTIPEDRQLIEYKINNDRVNGNSNTDVVTKLVHKDGSEIDVILRIAYIYDADGRYVSEFGNIIDLTTLVFTERALSESEKSYQRLIELLPGGVVETDLNGIVLSASNNACDILNISRDKLIGQNSFTIIDKAGEEEIIKQLEYLKGKNTTTKVRIKTQHKDKAPMYLDVLLKVIKPPEQKSKVFAIFIEVSDEVKAQEDLNRQTITLDTILESSPDCVCAIDQRYNMFMANNNMKKKLKTIYNVDYHPGMNVREVFPKEAFEHINKNYFQPTFEGDEIIDVVPVSIGDNTFIYKDSFAPLKINDDVTACVIYSHDITEEVNNQKIIEKQVVEMEKYIESNLQLENFAYIASHDLKAPLRTVNSFAFLLKNSVYKDLNERQKEFMDIILDSSKKMQILIDDLLTFSRINTQKTKIEKTNFRDILDQVIGQLDVDIHTYGTEVIIQDLPEDIWADSVKMSQLLLNLISNGIKFSKNQEKPKITISGYESDSYWYYSIADNGIGIKEDNQKVIFEIFKKLHSNDVFEGTGLGLTICSKIIDQHGGQIWVESTYGEGSTFHFSIAKQNQ